jgi:hypothetical protein
MASAISLTEPLHLQTTGDEFTNHYAIWRQIQGLPVYMDRFSPPYSYIMYNWLFYEFHGVVTGAILQLLSLGDPWLPTIGRVISLAAMVLGIVVTNKVFIRAAEAEDRMTRLLCLAFAVFIMAGPLLGFWNITVRADLWARTLEIIGVAIFLAKYPRQRWAGILWFIAFAYLSWAFKQGSVFAPGAVGLFLLARRDWKPMFLLAALLPTLWAATIFFGEPQYVYNFLLVDFPLTISPDRLLANILNFMVKSGPVLFFLAGLVVVSFLSRVQFSDYWRSDAFVISLAGTVFSAAISFPFSAQRGGAENYYFTLSFFLALMIIASIPILRSIGSSAMRRVLIAGDIGWVTIIIAIGLVFSGVTGVIDVRAQHVKHEGEKRCLDTLARPLFVNNPLLSLPWITPNDVPWVFSYNYYDDRRYGREFKEGGIGGLIAKGRFKTIAIPNGGVTSPPTELDGGSLGGYRLVEGDETFRQTCSGFFVFLRNDSKSTR